MKTLLQDGKTTSLNFKGTNQAITKWVGENLKEFTSDNNLRNFTVELRHDKIYIMEGRFIITILEITKFKVINLK